MTPTPHLVGLELGVSLRSWLTLCFRSRWPFGGRDRRRTKLVSRGKSVVLGSSVPCICHVVNIYSLSYLAKTEEPEW